MRELERLFREVGAEEGEGEGKGAPCRGCVGCEEEGVSFLRETVAW